MKRKSILEDRLYMLRGLMSATMLVSLIFFGSCGEEEEPNIAPEVNQPIEPQIFEEGFGSVDISLQNLFADANGDELTYTSTSSDENVVSATVSGSTLTLTEEGTGTATVGVTVSDGNGGSNSIDFMVTVNAAEIQEVILNFGSSAGNNLVINNWTSASVDGYVIAISNSESFSDLSDGNDPQASLSYWGDGEQVVYNGSSVSSFEISLLESEKTYYFKVYPYNGSRIYDNSQALQFSSTSNCETTSTTENQVCFSISSGLRNITSNQYPDHSTGRFPNADVTPTSYDVTVPIAPSVSGVTYVYSEDQGPKPNLKNFWKFGIASNGLGFNPMGLKPWENPNTGEQNWEWQAKVTDEGETDLDEYGAHVTSVGVYHYHGDVVALVDEDGSRHSRIYGFAADGFPVYYKYGFTDANDATSSIKELRSSYQLKSGARPGDGNSAPDGNYDGTYIQDFEYVEGLGDLDECNGRTGVTPEFPDGTYYYVITADFPKIPNCFKGTPDDTFAIGPGTN